jgi:hypothetical protein
MDIEHSRRSRALVSIPENGLDEFAEETAGLQVRREQHDQHALADSHPNVFTVIDAGLMEAGVRRGPLTEPSDRTPRARGAVLTVMLVSGGLASALAIGALIQSHGESSEPGAVAARFAVDVDTAALSPPPALGVPFGESTEIVPDVYRKPYVPPAEPAVSRFRITEIPGDVDVRTIIRAFARVSPPNLPFEHCDVQVTAADHAVAHCRDKLGHPSTWRMDLDRARGRWQLVPSTTEERVN